MSPRKEHSVGPHRSSSDTRAANAEMYTQRLMARKMSNAEQEKLSLAERAVKVTKSKAWTTALQYKKSRSCMLFTSITTLVSCVFYIVGTYTASQYHYMVIAGEAVFAVVFFMDYVLSVTAEAMWLTYVLSFEGIVDLCSIFPVFGAFYRWLYSLSFVRYLRLGKVARVIRNHRMLEKIGTFTDVTVTACLLGLKILGLILMTTAIIYGTEEAFKENDEGKAFEDGGTIEDSGTMRWHDSLYFTIVTLSTVGYGDVLPVMAISRMLMIAVILAALTYVPFEVGNLIDIIGSRPKNRVGYSRHLVGNRLHVVLAMVPGKDDGEGEAGFNAASLRRIIEELFHEDHGVDNESLWVVIISPSPPSPEVLSVIRSPLFMSRVIYFRGSVMDPLDMKAVCAEYADCIFLFPAGGGGLVGSSSVEMEEKTTLAAKSVQRYLNRTPTDAGLMRRVSEQSVMGMPCRTLVTVKELSSKEQLLRFGINHVVCHDELKMSMLACATLFPAFLPFAINAMRSSSDYTVPMDNTGEVKNRRSPSSDEAMATTAGGGLDHTWNSTSAQGGDGGGDGISTGAPPMWLTDYKRGMQYEVYSLALKVWEDSCLWGLTFSRAALELYEDSKGEVLLMAMVRDFRDVAAAGLGSGNAKATSADGLAAAAAAADSSSAPAETTAVPTAMDASVEGSARLQSGRGTRGDNRRRCEGVSASGGSGGCCAPFVHATIFPGDDFTFAGECNVLVLAESKSQAEYHLIKLQDSQPSTAESRLKPEEDEGQREDEAAAAARGKERGSERKGAKDSALPPAAAAVVLDISSSSGVEASFGASAEGPMMGEPAALHVTAAITGVSGGTGEAEEKVESGVAPGEALTGAGEPVKAETGEARARLSSSGAQAAAEEAGTGAAMAATAAVAVTAGWDGQANSLRRIPPRGGSTVGYPYEEQQEEQMEAVREEMRTEDGVRWKEALEALTTATGQLNSLRTAAGTFTESTITLDPKEFFSTVQEARCRLDDALRVQAAAVPEDLENHLVIIGAHPRLQYYVTAIRRQRPDVAIVVVTEDKEKFFELREKIAEAKCDFADLNITKIFSVTGKRQQRGTFNKARVANSAAVLLVSDEPNDTDVLLVSFELEQMLREIPAGQHAPKVLIDLHTDNSIYYCGNMLGRGGGGSTARRGRSSRILKESSALTSAGVWEWPLFAAGMVWTESIMEVFEVQTYFSTEFLAFFETLLQMKRPVLVGNELVDDASIMEPAVPPPVSPGRDGDRTRDTAPSAGASGKKPPSRHSPIRGQAGTASTVPPTGQFDMLRVASRKFWGGRYDALARELILQGAMPLGLYRPAGTKGSSLPYTQVNPEVSERLVEGDSAFVLRSRTCSLGGSV